MIFRGVVTAIKLTPKICLGAGMRAEAPFFGYYRERVSLVLLRGWQLSLTRIGVYLLSMDSTHFYDFLGWVVNFPVTIVHVDVP